VKGHIHWYFRTSIKHFNCNYEVFN